MPSFNSSRPSSNPSVPPPSTLNRFFPTSSVRRWAHSSKLTPGTGKQQAGGQDGGHPADLPTVPPAWRGGSSDRSAKRPERPAEEEGAGGAGRDSVVCFSFLFPRSGGVSSVSGGVSGVSAKPEVRAEAKVEVVSTSKPAPKPPITPTPVPTTAAPTATIPAAPTATPISPTLTTTPTTPTTPPAQSLLLSSLLEPYDASADVPTHFPPYA